MGFVVPAILRGHNPVAVALVGAMAIMLLSLYLSHGIGRKTTAAVVGTAPALGLTAALTAAVVATTSLTGLASEDALNASFLAGGLSFPFRGLLLAGISIGGLGVLDDRVGCYSIPSSAFTDRGYHMPPSGCTAPRFPQRSCRPTPAGPWSRFGSWPRPPPGATTVGTGGPWPPAWPIWISRILTSSTFYAGMDRT